MAKAFLMSWEGSPNFRWVKMFRGTRYRVTCAELGLAEAQWTKLDSYKAANAWWQEKAATLAATQAAIPPEKKAALDELNRRASWAASNAPQEIPTLTAMRLQLQKAEPADLPATIDEAVAANVQAAKLFGIDIPDSLPPEILERFFGKANVWKDRLKRTAQVAKERTVAEQRTKFLEIMRTRVAPQSYKEIKQYLENKIGSVLPDGMDVEQISEQTVTAHYLWLNKQPWGNPQKNKYRGFFNRFLKWMVDEKAIEPIANLASKLHRFKVVPKAIETFDNVKKAITALPDDKQLWAWLGVNCGMTNCDLGALTWEMLDLKKGTITRKRVKTKDNEKVPTVTYKLFPETLELLKAMPNKKGLVFTTGDGKPYYETWYDAEGVEHKKDLFALYWARLDPKPEIPLSKFRSIGSTILKKKNQYRGFVPYFLGHTPKEIADKHYSNESDEAFFEALDFIAANL